MSLWSSGQRIKEAEQRVAKLREVNEQTKNKLEYYRSQEFIEREARNKLNLVRPGEVVVLLPSPAHQVSGSSINSKIPNWEKWWKLFFE